MATQKERDTRKVASGANRLRMQKRQAAKYGLSLESYRELRAAVAICSALRRAVRAAPFLDRECEECERTFRTRREEQRICGSDECRRVRKNRLCSQSIMRRYYRDPDFRDSVIALSHVRRAERLGVGGPVITLKYLPERDAWVCGICGRKISSFDEASIDHVVPLSCGGRHDLANVQAAHRKCNYSKGNRGGGEQVRLIE